MRIRQIALAARSLDPVVEGLRSAFGVEVAFRDPAVATFGLRNAVVPVGETFVEVVSPVRDDAAAARFLGRNGGDGGYMVIFQTGAGEDLASARARIEKLGVRVVFEISLDDIATIHLHPRDVGGAIVSIDEARPESSWRWAGPDWRTKAQRGTARRIAGVELEAADPEALAARWAGILGASARATAQGGFEIELGTSTVGVSSLRERTSDGIVAIRFETTRPIAPVSIGGVRFECAPSPPPLPSSI
ncbi:Ethylmalonyl-CoA/methylmalonyl-CoA epimerase [Burkholderiales bacterium]|jgi:hypothetical protein|nr:Ethylmalonyl-CoA/methylmalonyl-CoA epimerase [Burkholderiales bacterium]